MGKTMIEDAGQLYFKMGRHANILKKIVMAMLLAVSMLFFCSCSNIRGLQLTGLTTAEGQKVKTMSQEIIQCLTEKDKNKLSSLFCKQVRDSGHFHTQVDELFSFFKCDTYVKSEIDTTASGGEDIEKGKRVKWNVVPEITYIEVVVVPNGDYDRICDRFYGVHYDWQITDAEDPSLEGLHNLTVELLNTDKSVTVGREENG